MYPVIQAMLVGMTSAVTLMAVVTGRHLYRRRHRLFLRHLHRFLRREEQAPRGDDRRGRPGQGRSSTGAPGPGGDGPATGDSAAISSR